MLLYGKWCDILIKTAPETIDRISRIGQTIGGL